MTLKIESANFLLKYKNIEYKYKKYNNDIIFELYRSVLYNKIISKLNNLIKEYNTIKIGLVLDIQSILIFNHKFKSKLDPIFDSSSPFNKKTLKKLFYEKCITYCNSEQRKILFKVIPMISDDYLNSYYNLKLNKDNLQKITFKIEYKIEQNFIYISLNISDNPFIQNNYKKELKIASHIFYHLVSLYNNNTLKKQSNEIADDRLHQHATHDKLHLHATHDKIIEYIYILFNRYYLFQNGNNQASILPSFKKLLKINLNIKIELFGSPINTSNFSFGSFFYDCEKVFGSIGDFFNTSIKKGYYELNPYFDKCVINKMFIKITKELIYSEKKQYPLLFCIIIPISYYDNNKLPKELDKFVSFDKTIDKNIFPYIRYDRDFKKTIVSAIVTTNIIICNTSFISNYVKSNLTNFEKIFNDWKK